MIYKVDASGLRKGEQFQDSGLYAARTPGDLVDLVCSHQWLTDKFVVEFYAWPEYPIQRTLYWRRGNEYVWLEPIA